ncbi:MAG TPA: HD domain-containing protein [Oculatellaceae cyanobacterium]|jgi:putative nucleotidyltransferase with HDIG domain
MLPEAASNIQALISQPLVQRVQALVKQAGGQAYLVGGAVRDCLSQHMVSKDLDFVLLNCQAANLAKQLADLEQGHLVPLDWDFGIHRVVFDNGFVVDLADALENDLQTDLARRDLTVNAIALDLETGSPIAPHHGLDDLQAKRIRMISEANLLEDPLRLLRVFRFAALLPAESIDADTLAVVRQHADAIWQAAGERIQYELFRFLSADHCFPYLKLMADNRLLEVLLPDLTPMRKIHSSGFHHLGLFDHTLELVRQAERWFPELPTKTREWLQQPFNPAVTRFGLVKLACLLHDIGKPATMGTKEDPVYGQRLTFYGHEEVGEKMAEPLLRRFKVSNDVMAYVKKLIRWHLYPCQFGPESPRKSVLRFYRRMGEETPDVTVLALADRHSATGPWLQPGELEKAHAAHIWLLENYEAESETLQIPRLLNGKTIMELLNLGPGPHLKTLLDALQEAQQLGVISNPDEAKDWLLSHWQTLLSEPKSTPEACCPCDKP